MENHIDEYLTLQVFYFKKGEKIIENNQNTLIPHFYMIGDNPVVDIKGANDSGYVSILVRTGVFQGDNDINNPAKYVVNNVGDAIDLITNIEGL